MLFRPQVLAHDSAGGPSVPAGALRAKRRVLADRVLARTDGRLRPAARRTAPA